MLGAGNNSYTDFRRLPASIPPRRAFNYTTGVVSSSELRAFWLLVDMATGLLAVGPDGGAPLLAWVDPDPLRIKYFSLCTWTEVHGTWLYGCGKAGTDSHDGPNAVSVSVSTTAPSFAVSLLSGSPLLDADWMTAEERLRQHVLTNDKKAAPHQRVDTRAELVVGRVAMVSRAPRSSVFPDSSRPKRCLHAEAHSCVLRLQDDVLGILSVSATLHLVS